MNFDWPHIITEATVEADSRYRKVALKAFRGKPMNRVELEIFVAGYKKYGPQSASPNAVAYVKLLLDQSSAKDRKATEAEYEEYEARGDDWTWEDPIQWGLGIAGMFPGFGAVADGINVVWYAGREKWLECGLSALSLIPVAGIGFAALFKAMKNRMVSKAIFETAKDVWSKPNTIKSVEEIFSKMEGLPKAPKGMKDKAMAALNDFFRNPYAAIVGKRVQKIPEDVAEAATKAVAHAKKIKSFEKEVIAPLATKLKKLESGAAKLADFEQELAKTQYRMAKLSKSTDPKDVLMLKNLQKALDERQLKVAEVLAKNGNHVQKINQVLRKMGAAKDKMVKLVKRKEKMLKLTDDQYKELVALGKKIEAKTGKKFFGSGGVANLVGKRGLSRLVLVSRETYQLEKKGFFNNLDQSFQDWWKKSLSQEAGGGSSGTGGGGGAAGGPVKWDDDEMAVHCTETFVQLGCKGKRVKLVQMALKKLGFDTKVNGDFDIQTKRALKAYQQSRNMITTGEADKDVFVALAQEISGAQQPTQQQAMQQVKENYKYHLPLYERYSRLNKVLMENITKR